MNRTMRHAALYASIAVATASGLQGVQPRTNNVPRPTNQMLVSMQNAVDSECRKLVEAAIKTPKERIKDKIEAGSTYSFKVSDQRADGTYAALVEMTISQSFEGPKRMFTQNGKLEEIRQKVEIIGKLNISGKPIGINRAYAVGKDKSIMYFEGSDGIQVNSNGDDNILGKLVAEACDSKLNESDVFVILPGGRLAQLSITYHPEGFPLNNYRRGKLVRIVESIELREFKDAKQSPDEKPLREGKYSVNEKGEISLLATWSAYPELKLR